MRKLRFHLSRVTTSTLVLFNDDRERASSSELNFLNDIHVLFLTQTSVFVRIFTLCGLTLERIEWDFQIFPFFCDSLGERMEKAFRIEAHAFLIQQIFPSLYHRHQKMNIKGIFFLNWIYCIFSVLNSYKLFFVLFFSLILSSTRNFLLLLLINPYICFLNSSELFLLLYVYARFSFSLYPYSIEQENNFSFLFYLLVNSALGLILGGFSFRGSIINFYLNLIFWVFWNFQVQNLRFSTF